MSDLARFFAQRSMPAWRDMSGDRGAPHALQVLAVSSRGQGRESVQGAFSAPPFGV